MPDSLQVSDEAGVAAEVQAPRGVAATGQAAERGDVELGEGLGRRLARPGHRPGFDPALFPFDDPVAVSESVILTQISFGHRDDHARSAPQLAAVMVPRMAGECTCLPRRQTSSDYRGRSPIDTASTERSPTHLNAAKCGCCLRVPAGVKAYASCRGRSQPATRIKGVPRG